MSLNSSRGFRLSGRRRPMVDNPATARKHRPDYILLVLMSLLLVVGAIVVYAIGPGLTNGTNLPENYYSNKQLIAIVLGIIGFFIAANVSIDNWKKLQPFVIFSAILVALAVRFIGDEVNGAHRWLQVGGFSFQAAELIKFAIVLWVAQFLSIQRLNGSLNSTKTLKQLGVATGIVVVVVAGLQGDFGSAAVMVAILGVTSYVAGLPIKKLGMVAAGIFVLGTVAIVSTPYRRDRIATYLNPAADCQKEGYQVCQALITVGSGGMLGKGLGRSVQAYGYLPYPENDSIFAIVAEKFGFVGSVFVVGVFWMLFRRMANIAKAAPTDYMRLLVVGVLVWLSVQMAINVGAMIGLLPLKGITLPFVSYGGTSIIFVMIAMGIVFQISRYTDLTALKANRSKQSEGSPRAVRFGRRPV